VMGSTLVAGVNAQQRDVAGPPECPGDGIRFKVESLTTIITHVPLSDVIADIPEFHDCQRFPNGSGFQGDQFGSLYAIFAAVRLDSVLTDLTHSSDSIANPGGTAYISVPVATIYTPDGVYPPLGIQPGFNCLFLYPKVQSAPGAQPSQWGAKMVHVGADSNCVDPHIVIYPATVGTTLEVKPSSQTVPFKDADYPAVARWDRDTTRNGHQYIGIKCGAAWCEIGERAFTPSAPCTGRLTFDPVPGVPVTSSMKLRVTAIKGWYDEQWLAKTDANGVTRPSTVHGCVFPNPALDALSRLPPSPSVPAPGLKYYAHTWVHVASAVVTQDYGKWNLTKGLNRIFLCHGEAGVGRDKCTVNFSRPVPKPWTKPLQQCQGYPAGDPPWWAKIVSATGTLKYACVRRWDHAKEIMDWNSTHYPFRVELPGTTRWRWLFMDEGNWISCPSGCCPYKT
jgi:hypothetical protein